MAEKQKAYLKKRYQKSSPKKKKIKEEIVEVQEERKPSAFLSLIKRIGDHWQILSLIPVLFMIGIIPLMVYAKIIVLTPLEERNWTGGTYHLDFFSYYKAKWLVIATILLVLIYILLLVFKKIKFKKQSFIIPLGIYLLFVIISTIVAQDQIVALRGFMEMFQGFYVLISYVLITFILSQIIEKENQVKIIMGAFIFLGVIVGLIGFYQYIGKDIIQTEFGLKLIMSKELEEIIGVGFIFGKYDIYATMGNTNFVGSYAALMIPLAFILYLYSKNLIYQIFSIIFLGLMLLVAYGSNSRAGMIGIAVSLTLIVVLFRHMFISKTIKIIFPFFLMFVVGVMLNHVTEGRVSSEIESINLFEAIKDAKAYADTQTFITRLEVVENKLFLETEQSDLVLEWKNNGLWPYDLENQLLAVNVSGQIVTFVDEAYKDFRIQIFEDQNAFTITTYGKSFHMYVTNDGLRVLANGSVLEIPVMPDRIIAFDDYGKLFSSRLFIWSRSIPLMKDYFFIGSGPDHYPIVYPQNDVAGKLNYMGLYTIVDKPHNMYIQTGINTGVLSLLAMITVLFIYVMQSSKIYFKKLEGHFLKFIGTAFFTGILAYLAAGMFNDQRVSVAPLFYIMLGLGFAINSMILKENAEKSKQMNELSI